MVIANPNAKTAPSTPIAPARGSSERTHRYQTSHANLRNDHSKNPADNCKKQTLRKQLPYQTHSSGAKCGPQGELTAPPRAARQQEIGDVHAHDEEHKNNSAENHQQRGLDAARDLVLQPAHNHLVGRRRRNSHTPSHTSHQKGAVSL